MAKSNKEIQSILDQQRRGIREAIRERTISYILAAFGLVAGLAWNEAVKSLIEYIFPVAQKTLLAKFVYAVVLTIVLVIFSVYLARFIKGEKKE